MSRPLLRREYRRSGFRTVVALFLAAGLALVLLLLASGRPGLSAQSPRALLRLGLLAQTALVVLLTPALTLGGIAGERATGTLPQLFLSPWKSSRILLVKSVLPALATAALLLFSGLPLAALAWRLGPGSVAALVRAELVLAASALALLALGHLCSTVFADLSSAAGAAYLVVLLASAAPLLAGPLLQPLPAAGALIPASLVISPLVDVSAALGFDVMRSEWIYRLSPIGQRRFSYPSWTTAGAFFLVLASIAFWASVRRLAALRRGFAS